MPSGPRATPPPGALPHDRTVPAGYGEGRQSRTPASRTGRPRSAAADTAILAATRDALVELGWSKLTLGDVVTRAGVAKTTLYRRWAGKPELVCDAVAE